MSATNRGSKRIERDNYPTPLSAFTPLLPYLSADGQIWEPACGDRRLIHAMNSHPGLVAAGSDLSEGYDFLKDGATHHCIVTNPPFSIAFEFTKHAVDHACEIFLLLPLSFLGSKMRRDWFRKFEPCSLFVLSDRPSFVLKCRCAACSAEWYELPESGRPTACECGGKVKITSSDAMEYAWFYWGGRHEGIYHL